MNNFLIFNLKLMIKNRVSLQKGQLPRVNQAQDPSQRPAIFDKIPSWISLKLRCQDLNAHASEAMLNNGLGAMSLDREQSLDVLLRTYEGQTDELEFLAHTGNYFLPMQVYVATNFVQTISDLMCSSAGWLFRASIFTKHIPYLQAAVVLGLSELLAILLTTYSPYLTGSKASQCSQWRWHGR